MLTLTLVVALLTLALLASIFGVFFAYSNSVVPALDRVEAERAVDAMRKVNTVIVNPLFLLTFIGPVITGAVTGFLLLGLAEHTSAYLFFAATATYLVGGVILTSRMNIPLNNALENSTSTDWEKRWADFSPRWRRWNTIRGFLALAALILCGLGLYTWGD
ncbi:MAG: DUF1772 domain-containing protein [Pseudonocardiaceae bacterium]|nr:DUF1772 domain-containing protein [Pseudonocardiaceae bacterium]